MKQHLVASLNTVGREVKLNFDLVPLFSMYHFFKYVLTAGDVMSSRAYQCALQLFCQCLGSLPKLGLTGRTVFGTVVGSMLKLAHALV